MKMVEKRKKGVTKERGGKRVEKGIQKGMNKGGRRKGRKGRGEREERVMKGRDEG